jgi:hypothetical protein
MNEETSMKKLLCLILAFLAAPAMAQAPVAQESLAGTWQGRLEAAPGTTLTIRFIIKAAPGGGYTAVVTSPDEGAIKNVAAKSVKFADKRLTLDVPALSGGYEGTLRNGALEGVWLQEGQKLPLNLRLFEASPLTREEIEALRGEWSGTLKTPNVVLTLVFRFSTAADGKVRAVMDVPEQGVKDWEATDVALDDGHFSMKVPRAALEVKGELEGEQLVGQTIQFGVVTPVTLKKGKYVAPVVYLQVPAATRDLIKGRWSGILGPLKVAVRFESDRQGRTIGFFDSPDQNITGIPITEVALNGTRLTFGIAGFGAKYSGELAGGKLTGEWSQLGMPNPVPLTLTRGN